MKRVILSLAVSALLVFSGALLHAQESLLKRKTIPITAGTDDAEEDISNGAMYLSEENLELCYHYWTGGGRNQIIGLRFAAFGLPTDAIIDSAYLQFFSKQKEIGTANFTIKGETSNNSGTFSGTSYNISSRNKTSASVTWAVPPWSAWGEQGLSQRSPDIAPILREIVAQTGFTSASPVTLFLQGTGTRVAQPFETDPFAAPKLIINYRLPAAVSNPAPYKDRYAPYFPFGTAASSYRLNDLQKLGTNNVFNHFTAEYEMKWEAIQPQYNVFAFDGADAIANHARANNMKMTGHTFVWHWSNPAWLFQNGPDGAISKDVLSARLQKHIDKLVERYGDIVDNWDVVNEATSDAWWDPNKVYRDGGENSQWWTIFGSQEYIKVAFQYAAQANAKYGRTAKLFYNDYDVPDPGRLNKVLAIVDYLKAQGVQIDGVGMQGHWRLNNYPIHQIKAAFDKIISRGLKIKISELDMSIYDPYTKDYAAPLTAAAEQEQAYRYQELFELFREYKEHIHSITVWGISDKDSWLNYNMGQPVSADKWDYPLLFDENFNPKKAFYSIMDFAAEGSGGGGGGSANQPPTAVLKASPMSGNAPLTVAFDGTDSYDTDGTIVEHSWFFGDGGYGTGASQTRTYKSAGTYPIELTVKDNMGGTSSESAVITVSPDKAIIISVQNISITTVKSGDKTAAQVTVLVLNAAGNPVSGVRVYGTWSNGLVSGNVSGLTDVNGLLTLTSSYTTKKGAITFTVNDLMKLGFMYDGCQNQQGSASVNVN